MRVNPKDRRIGSRIFSDPFGLRVGESIPGSRYIRGVCSACGEPIRVSYVSTCDYCRDCVTAHIPPDTRPTTEARSDRIYHGREYAR
jgi:hypothetical protein